MIALDQAVLGAVAVVGAAAVTAVGATVVALISRSRAVSEKADSATEKSIEAKTIAEHTAKRVDDRIDTVARDSGAMDELHRQLDAMAGDIVRITTTDAETKRRLMDEITRATRAAENCEQDRANDRRRIIDLERDVAQNKAVLHRLAPGLIQPPEG